ncbi:MAG: CehA/McbA family metallohydrolase [Chloroflexota bacterium]
MNNLPFGKPGKFWRGNLHTHSTRSDGMRTPEAVCRFYRENGYDFIAVTDHFLAHYEYPIVDTTPFRQDDFTTIIGAELHAGQTELGNLWHILAVGLPLDFNPPTEAETGPQIAARALDAGAFVAAAHPQWYTLTERDVVSLGDIHAIEIYNAACRGLNDRADSWYLMDMMLAQGRRYSGCATDDAHFNPEFGAELKGWVYIKAEALTPEALLQALKSGSYYSSTGLQIHDIQVTKEEVIVCCSPADSIFLAGRNAHSVRVYGHGLDEAILSRRNFNSPYGRIVVRDAFGRRAWSNPFWFSE